MCIRDRYKTAKELGITITQDFEDGYKACLLYTSENESYAYAVLPDKSADAVRQYAQGENITILENNKTVQAVHDASTDSTGIVFWPENRAFLSAHLPLNDFFYDGIRPRSISSTILRTIGVTVKGKTGVATADAALGCLLYTSRCV